MLVAQKLILQHTHTVFSFTAAVCLCLQQVSVQEVYQETQQLIQEQSVFTNIIIILQLTKHQAICISVILAVVV